MMLGTTVVSKNNLSQSFSLQNKYKANSDNNTPNVNHFRLN